MSKLQKYMLFVLAGVGAAPLGHGQAVGALKSQPVDVATMFQAERTQYTYGDNFWIYGGSGEVAVRFLYHLGLVVNVTGTMSQGNNGNQSFSKVMTTAGPRFRLPVGHGRSQLFVEGLFGGVHGFNSVFPAPDGPVPSANAFAMQAGGGYDLSLSSTWSLRVLDLHYVHTDLPNGFSNRQNDMQVGAGIVWRPIDRSAK